MKSLQPIVNKLDNLDIIQLKQVMSECQKRLQEFDEITFYQYLKAHEGRDTLAGELYASIKPYCKNGEDFRPPVRASEKPRWRTWAETVLTEHEQDLFHRAWECYISLRKRRRNGVSRIRLGVEW